jgi:hypothetical protein
MCTSGELGCCEAIPQSFFLKASCPAHKRFLNRYESLPSDTLRKIEFKL